jgi:hypothetical protein
MLLVLGNRDAVQSLDNGETFERLPKGKRATTVEIPEGYSVGQALRAVTDAGGVWSTHASDGATPAWVAGDHDGLVQLVAEHFGGIEIRKLEVDA